MASSLTEVARRLVWWVAGWIGGTFEQFWIRYCHFNLYLLNCFQYHRTPMNFLLVNLAVADILYATFIIPKVLFKLIFTHPGGVTGTFLCKFLIRGNVAWVGGISSIITLVAIAIERYNAVVYPYKWRITKRKLKVCHLLLIRMFISHISERHTL